LPVGGHSIKLRVYAHKACPATYAGIDIDDLARDIGFKPATPIEDGIPRFVKWYREFYRV